MRRALETLGLEDEEGLQYRVSIMDYETGINHTIEVRIIKNHASIDDDNTLDSDMFTGVR